MSLKAQFDMPKLQAQLRKFSKKYGDTTSQAVMRWGAQTTRELAFETQPFGAKSLKTIQKGAIIKDIYAVMIVADSMTDTRRGFKATTEGRTFYVSTEKGLRDPDQVISWMRENRGKNGRTNKVPAQEKRVCTRETFNGVVKKLMENAGIAKGGFIGAGQMLVSMQTGEDRVVIGKSFMAYAQKHSKFGAATRPTSGFSSNSKITNNARHTSQDYVIKKSAMSKAIGFGLSKTVKWYRKTLNAIDKKKL